MGCSIKYIFELGGLEETHTSFPRIMHTWQEVYADSFEEAYQKLQDAIAEDQTLKPNDRLLPDCAAVAVLSAREFNKIKSRSNSP